MLELKMRFFCVSLLCLLCLYAIKGDLNGIFGPCCHEGVQWSSTSYRCDNYPTPIDNISDSDQAACLSVIEVCCIKQTQLQTCEDGKQTALDNSVCAIRDADPGAEQFRECCHCCQLGLVSRMSESTCQSPDLGEPCDSKYRECCQGLETSNISYIGIKRENNEDLTRNTSQVTEDNIDECNIFPGNVCSHICVDMPRGFYCSCPEGLHLDVNDNRTCTDKVEESTTSTTLPAETQSCELNNPCEQRCIDNKLTGIECQCYDGYHLATDLISCEDIDECAQGLAVCATGQRCVNTRGHFTCTASQCPAGSQLNPITSQCESYVQQCGIGFSYNTVSRTCEDINECGLGIDACGTGERCENAVGSYVCRRERHCGTGYTLDESSQSCIDNDECTLGTHNCNGGYRCQNVQGSFRCVQRTCPEGYRFVTAKGECVLVQCPVGLKSNEAGNCVDIDECEEYGLAVCNRHQKCVNTRGSYYCRNFVNCPPGYEPTENNGCHDIDECYRGTHKCGIEQQCINRQGTYFCQCPRGMRHDTSGRCMDVDECSYGATICPSNSKCVNTVGSYKCDCIDGLVSDENDGCTDVNECETEGVCQQSCVNVLGTFFCSCSRGYQLRDDKRSCEDIDECTQFGNRIGRSGVCGGKCINLPGSYRCECPDGWRLKPDGRSCEDINECKEHTAYCTHSESICINTRGSYKCPIVRCPEGFVKTNATGQQNSIRCKRVSTDCQECRRGIISRTYNFLSFATNVIVPAPLFSMTGSRLIDKFYTWDLDLISARVLKTGILPAVVQDFSLEKSRDFARVTLIKRIDGPQDVVLKLSMNVTSYYKGFEGIAESRIYLYITEEDNN
uniref:Fibulin-1 n=1 Tax=Arion vulgaris TaxID=1028688 RepID=A0A0B7AEM3_9EUPU